MSDLRFIYQYEIAAIILCVTTIIILLHRKSLQNRKNIIFIFLVVVTLLSAIFDAISNIMINDIARNKEVNMPALEAMISIFLLVHNLTPFLFFIYVSEMIGKIRNRKKLYLIYSIPYIVIALLIITNHWTTWVFYFSASNEYLHHFAIYIVYAVAFGYLVLALIQGARYRKALPKGYAFLVAMFIVLAVIAIAIQFFVERFVIEIFISSLVLLVMAFNFETEEQSRNAVTRLYNSSAFLIETERCLYNKRNYDLLIIKIADLRRLNTINGVKVVDGILAKVGQFFLSAKHNRYFDCGGGNICAIFDNKEDLNEAINVIKERFKKPFTNDNINMLFTPLYFCLSMPDEVSTIKEISLLLEDDYQNRNEDGIVALNRLKREVAIEEAIQRAIDNDTLLAYYQAIYSNSTKSINSAEALARIDDPILGFLSPVEFIPVAEKSGKISQLGLLILERVCQFYNKHDVKKLGLDYIEVNLSALQIIDPSIYDSIMSLIKKYNVPASFINFEITESALIENSEVVIEIMDKLIKEGFSFSLDDFGTGYSNFTYLYDMKFNIVKIDKSILDKTINNQTASKTLISMIGMLKDISFRVLQEGVETASQEDLLIKNGIDYIQGYYYSHPIPEDDFIKYLESHKND